MGIELRQVADWGYDSWEQVSGYFDGDGSVSVEVSQNVLRFRIRFVDTWRPQIESIRSFLMRRGIRVGSVLRDKKDDPMSGYRIEVGRIEDVLKTAKVMLPLCVKKQRDLEIVVDYLEGRISGTEALARFNEEVRAGRRSGVIRHDDVPFTKSEGFRRYRLAAAARARAGHIVVVPHETEVGIKKDHIELKLGYIRLSKKYGYSQSVIRRVLRQP